MCLQKVNFTLSFNKRTKEYKGIGYKAYGKDSDRRPKGNKWHEATGLNIALEKLGKCSLSYLRKDGIGKEISSCNEHYAAGFHIFTDVTAARDYFSSSPTEIEIYKVEFKEVLGFGKQGVSKRITSADCVIARYMRIVKKVE